MITYTCRFDDGESFGSFKTKEEAMKHRSENNFRFISRSIHVFMICTSKVNKNLRVVKKIV